MRRARPHLDKCPDGTSEHPLGVGEGTTRRGTATPVHRPQRPAGSSLSSVFSLRTSFSTSEPVQNVLTVKRLPQTLFHRILFSKISLHKGLAGEARLQPLYQRLNMGMHGAGVGKKRIWADQRIVFLIESSLVLLEEGVYYDQCVLLAKLY